VRHCYKCAFVFILNSRYACRILTKLAFSRQIFKKYLDIKFKENSSIGNRVVFRCGQTNKHVENNSLLPNFVNAPKKVNAVEENNLCLFVDT
jgi:hypothetical protein